MRHPAPAGRKSWLNATALAASIAVLAALAGPLHAQCNFDVDDNGVVDALTDGLLIQRALSGLTGTALTQGALGANANRTDPTQILNFINANKPQYDFDGNGTPDSKTDGLMLIRYLIGMSGTGVTDNALANPAPRNDWLAINGHLQTGCGSGSQAELYDAARFLTQATWGPKYAEVYQLAGLAPPKIDNWITTQFGLPRSTHIDWIIARDVAGNVSMSDSYESFWMQALAGADQLRQRVAFALSQILVVSDQKDGLGNPYLMSGYFDTLSRNAFGNYRTLLEEITKTPAMALYLDHMCNDGSGSRMANENYAREVLQLFSIGTVWLNPDGTLMLDNGSPIPTYDQNTIQGFARVFTGWSYSGSASWCQYPQTNAPWYNQMIGFNSRHSIGAKTLLALTPNGVPVTLPGYASQAAANAQATLTAGLDNIFNHPNVGPYISKQLIHFLVTSNPTPAYVSRVAAKFADNGGGVRGDMQAVIRAVLTDTEARDLALAQGTSFGKLREPAVRFGNLMRTFHATAASGRYNFWTLGDPQFGVNQQPLSSPTVFNFYGFDYAPQGAVASHGLIGPEFEVTTSTSIVTTSSNLMGAIFGGWGSGGDQMVLDTAALAPLAPFPNLMLDYLNLVMTGGAITQTTRNQVITTVSLIPQTGSNWQRDRWRAAIYIIFNSPEYVIQR